MITLSPKLLVWIAVGLLITGLLTLTQCQSGKIDRLKAKNEQATQQTKQQTQRAETAEVSNNIATEAHGRMDSVRFEVMLPAEKSAQRIQNHAKQKPNPDPADDIHPDILRELEQADKAYSSAADSVRGTHSR